MVERWWGRRGVYALDFARLVRPASGGILTTDLESATRARGWDTHVFRGTPERVRQNLHDGVPVVVLIEVAHDRYHYIVVLGWSDGRVVFHDPATGPFTSLDENTFLARWARADLWALVVRPAPVAAVTASADSTALVAIDSTLPCPPWLDRALDAVAANRLDDASSLLDQAGRACPSEPLVLRETAGVRFKQGRYVEVIRLVSEYLALVPDDELGWQLLATGKYLAGDRDGALQAWNVIGRPTVDLVRINGVRAIRFTDIAGAMSAPPGSLLTPARLALARRRVSDVPALRRASVDYQPVPGGIVEVRAVVRERPTLDGAWRLAATGAIRAFAQSEVGLELASPTGAGELWSANWRWKRARPRASLRLDMPVHPSLLGVITIEGAWERFRFALHDAQAPVVEEARFATVGLSSWVTANLRPSAALRLERWTGNLNYLAVSLGAELRARGDRLVMTARSERAVALSAHPSYSSGSAGVAWASSAGLSHASLSARMGIDWVGKSAPFGMWPVAGGDLAWSAPLRAHAPTSNGLLTGQSVGRRIFHGGLGADRPLYRTGLLVIAGGMFVDAADVVASADGSPDARLYVDGGAGLRIGVADGQTGVLRIDLAKGLVTDRQLALTLGVHRNWPLFQRDTR